MRNKSNKAFVTGIKDSIQQTKAESDSIENGLKNQTNNKFDQGLSLTREIMSGSRVKTPRLLVETSQCKLWEKHNRAFKLLNEVRCKDLIDQFKETGKQEFPAIVRLVENGGEIKYEIICGARRYWTAKYLGWKYFIEIRELSDEEAFRLSDIENRAREDISDYERALDYKRALSNYYENQVQMAGRLEVSTSWLSRYLDMADFPQEIVEAYRDITEIKIIHARKLKPFLSGSSENRSNKEKLINKAIELKGKGCDGSKVIAELLSAVKIKVKRSRPKQSFSSSNGLVNMQVRITKDKKVELVIEKLEKASKEDVLELLTSTIPNFF